MIAEAHKFSLKTLRRSCIWAAVAVILLGAQFGLAAHQLEHHLHPDIAAIADDCIACQFASVLSDGPSASAFIMPIGIDLGTLVPGTHVRLELQGSPAGFRSRAPPHSVSV